jgi:tripartite-type tricarboxylate transporter receptor subunit TctC
MKKPLFSFTDVVTRVVRQKMQALLGQPIVVDNRPGADSMLGANIVAAGVKAEQ